MKYNFLILTLLLCYALSSCSGYKFINRSNPLAQYGIHSIAIPMFQNTSSVPNVSGAITKEVTTLLSQFSDLRVYPGEWTDADAILIGKVYSEKYIRDAFVANGKTLTSSIPNSNIGKRRDFAITSGATITLWLNLILIKHPRPDELKLLEGEMGLFVKNHPKIVFNANLPMIGGVGYAVTGNSSPDNGGVTNYTRTQGNINKTIQTLAKSASDSFKELILYVF